MLRADNVICGTSTTGTGTLTLAACPSPPGGLDFDKWLKATGLNFVSTNALLVSYTIIEYTDATFATAKQTEKGIGTLTLGASITAATLARTTVQSIATGLNATPSPTYSAPTAITIGTAANTLVFVGASVDDIQSCSPYWVNTFDTDGVMPASMGNQTTLTLSSGTEYHALIDWRVPMLVKRATFKTSNGTITGATMSAYVRLYALGTDGKPGKLLYDFGQVGTSSAFQSQFTKFSSGASGNGFRMTPGLYWASLFVSWSGGSGTTILVGDNYPLCPGNAGTTGLLRISSYTATGGSAGAAPDPANVTGWTALTSNPPAQLSVLLGSS